MERREILRATGVAAVTALTGCLDTESGTTTEDSTEEPTGTANESAAYEAPIRRLWAAYAEENVTGMRAAYHPDSPQGVPEGEVNFGNEITLGNFTVQDRSDEALTVEVAATVTERGQTQSVTHSYELRRENGEWAIWRFTVGPAGSDSSEQSRPTAPQVAFAFEYDGEATDRTDTGVLTITHTAGDTIDAAALFVRGTGIVDPSGARPAVTARGTSWAAAAGASSVTAGDSLTVGVASDCEITLVWADPDEDVSATLAEYDGPDA